MFIMVHGIDGAEVIINLDNISMFEKGYKGTDVYTVNSDFLYTCRESMADVIRLITAAYEVAKWQK